MNSPYRIERDRGIKDSTQQLAVLREKWPLAFPAKLDDVRPLAAGVNREIAATMGWSLPYTLGVLGTWKLAAFYCRAVLQCDHRITLDGAPAEPLDAEAKEMATKRLAELAARRALKDERVRGTKDFPKQLAVLREKWPLAFPVKLDDVRPLAAGVNRQIAATTGWSLPYTLGVLGGWEFSPFYCRAVLQYDHRITLDGAPAEPVDAKAKEMATKHLAELAAGRAAKKALRPKKPSVLKPTPPPIVPLPETPKPTVTAAKKAAKKARKTAAVAKPAGVSRPIASLPETPEQLGAKIRTSLQRRSA
jgi:sRNA-binding protein